MPTAHLTAQAARKNPSLRLGDVNDFAEQHPAFKGKPGAVRALINRADENGLNKHIYRIGRRVLIDLNGAEDWIRGLQASHQK